MLQFMGEHTVDYARYASRCCEQTLRRIRIVECRFDGGGEPFAQWERSTFYAFRYRRRYSHRWYRSNKTCELGIYISIAVPPFPMLADKSLDFQCLRLSEERVGGSDPFKARDTSGLGDMLPASTRLSWAEFALLPFALNAEEASGAYAASVPPPASQLGPFAV